MRELCRYRFSKSELESINKDGYISSCKKYRYFIEREWDSSLDKAMFILLNPSETGLYEDNPTIRKCMGFSKGLGYGGIYLANLYSYRATNPKELKKVIEKKGEIYAQGEKNIEIIKKLEKRSDILILGWGNNAKNFQMSQDILKILDRKKMRCLDITKEGEPKHPLYIRYDLVERKEDLKIL